MQKPGALPADWQQDYDNLQTQYVEQADESQQAWLHNKLTDISFSQQLAAFWLGSQFALAWCCRFPQWLPDLMAKNAQGYSLVDVQPDEQCLSQSLSDLLVDINDETSLMRVLRLFRQQQMLRIIWRDINRLATTLETTAALTALADVSLGAAIEYLYPRLCDEFGTPCSESGVPQSFLVLGMGKLGAFELNLSSDIDLIFAYDESGETQGRPRKILNREFFTKLGQKLITVIDKSTADGFVFRVDMRLRPYGDSGALVLNYDAMEQYYQQQGRDWERYAMIKARLIYGDVKQAAPLLDMLRGFTFRRYLDFASIASLRDLKRQIEREVTRKGMHDNVKLGPGGIREIEFIVQSFQLIHGGRDRDLQPAPVIPMLAMLEAKGLLSGDDVSCLREAYFFLRDVEHLIQAWRDEQTQMLPRDPVHQARIAWLTGFADWAAFYAGLQVHRDQVRRIFSAVIAPPADEETASATSNVSHLWDATVDSDQESEVFALQEAGFSSAAAFQAVLLAWRSDKILLTLPTESRERLARFMPLLLNALLPYAQPDIVLLRLLPLLRAVLRRSAYLVLLIENPQALKQLVLLVDASTWIAEQLAAAPVLLDELIDPRNLYRDAAPSREELHELLRQQLLHIPEEDLEAQMEALRHFKRSHGLRAAACEVTQRLPLMKVSDYLTFMAEVILDHVLRMAWKPLVDKHGMPRREDGTLCDPGFIVVGYGKLGGLELGHGSDLDLVFIHNGGSGETAAEVGKAQTPVENGVFFARLGQKIIHILNTRTVNGILYEVDMRLRPSGNSGLLVATLNSFERYQEKDAWTWEHQALVRARVVAGCPVLADAFNSVRANILGRDRDRQKLAQDVIEMRQKMRTQLDKSDATHFDVKQGAGGIVDLEFLVQFSVLAWSHQYPALTVWPDNIRILEQLVAADLMKEEQAQALMEAYRRLRARGHRRTLLGESNLVAGDELADERAVISRAWQQFFSPYE